MKYQQNGCKKQSCRFWGLLFDDWEYGCTAGHRWDAKGLPCPFFVEKPGYYKGLHYTKYVDQVKRLKSSGNYDKAEELLLHLIDAVEAEAKAEGCGVAPWYYEQLAIIYRKRKDYQAEVAILERFARQKHAPGAMPPILLDRLVKARKLLTEGSR